ncbi:MAG: AbrB/MazE/SpoVT family DNA-binding domain-containing protein [Methanomicrobiales archaeon]|nr:AbrB/MazE/SpoVT family DNA-binding domain-containing protein [Methanomicrobiales archaeon]
MGKGKTEEKSFSDDLSCDCHPRAGCTVEAVLTVDERGQIVLPKDIRERAEIKPGDKLALVSWEKDGSICCIALIKTERLSGMVKEVLTPLMNDTGA